MTQLVQILAINSYRGFGVVRKQISGFSTDSLHTLTVPFTLDDIT